MCTAISIAERQANRHAYVLVTPARNEAQFIGLTITSVVQQTIRPVKWVIVSDGSTDGTDELVSMHAAQHDWIELVRTPERRDRHFAGKVDAFNTGYARVKGLAYQVIVNLDADVSFEDPTYFEFLMNKFAENPRLGVCGTAYREGNAIFPTRFTNSEDVFGACQMFRRECFEAIGGYPAIKSGGIDLIAFLSARRKGWQTWTFTEKFCLHHRQVGSAQNKSRIENLLQAGRKDYLLGCHPAWEVFRSLYYMKTKPWILGGVLMFGGYVGAMLSGTERTIPEDLLELRRDEQMKRLKWILRRMLLVKSTTADGDRSLPFRATDVM
jgi:glycosyltransferase involved in cell wall biosynthesis